MTRVEPHRVVWNTPPISAQSADSGLQVSSGCIRMVNAHVEELYNLVKVGTPVIVR